jgi:hypothetical protein
MFFSVLRIRDVYPGSRRNEINLLSYLFCSHKNHKIENYINFELVKKKIWANLQRIIELYTQKIVNKL